MWRQLRPALLPAVNGLLLAVLSGMLSTLDPLLMRSLIDSRLPHHDMASSLLLVFAIVGCLLGSVLALLWSNNLNFTVEQEIGQRLRIAILEQLNRLSADFHENTPAGENMTRLGADVDQISQLAAEIGSSTVRAAVFLLVNLGVMLYLNATMTLAIVPTLFLFSWLQNHFASLMRQRADIAQSETGRASSILYEYISSLPQIQLLCAEKVVVANAVSVWSGMVLARKRQKGTELLYSGTINASFLLATLLVLGFGSYQFMHNALTIGALVAFYAYQTRVFAPVSIATDLYSRLQRVGASVRRVRAVLDSEPQVPDMGHITTSPKLIRQGLTLDGIQYSYRGDRPALNGISLHVAAGESLAIVGPSGSGKSTLARLLVRLSDPQRGSLTLDGYSLRDYSLSALRQTICFVPQKPIFFNGSIRENLLYANPAATDSELGRVLDVAQFIRVLDRLPNGLDTQLGPSGYSLSGGELQRLALARALLRKAPVFVLDECTSALDVPTEQLILASIAEYCTGSVLIVITHRLASVAWVKRIAVLDRGQIAAAGDHNTLYERSLLYRTLYQAQPLTLQ